MLHTLSHRWARVELALAGTFAVLITALILLNVITRAFSVAIYWVDEAAIYAMVWMTFLAASAAVAHRSAVAVTLVPDALPAHLRPALIRAVDVVTLVFALAIVWVCWRWFLPLDLVRAGFDTQAFQGATFNFIYAEPTNTLGIAKVWVWLVMPLFAFGTLLHSVANLTRGGDAQ